MAKARKPRNEDIFGEFITTVRDGGLTNPYGLAAVAATGQSESGFDAKNVYGSWEDPSESGKSGTSGGVMSWRDGRLANMRQFAADAGDDPMAPSARTQAKFLLSEDPDLIAGLNNAKSAEEAQRMMNRAWAFAGYDREGGETANRIARANAFLPVFETGTSSGSSRSEAQPVAASNADVLDMLSGFAVGGATRDDTFSGMNGEFSGALGNLFASAPPEIRDQLRVSSGFRSNERQAELYEEALRKYGNEATARKWVAPPGRSQHNHGNAADLKFLSDDARKWVHENAGQFGLAFPLSNENWHIELASARGGKAPAHNHEAAVTAYRAEPQATGGQQAIDSMLLGFTDSDGAADPFAAFEDADEPQAAQPAEQTDPWADFEDAEAPAATTLPSIQPSTPPPPAEPAIDPDIRVPKLIRTKVGNYDKPEDRLRALREHYPDAQPTADGDNFTFTDPETGKRGLYNPEGLDWGDLFSLAPEVGELIGGAAGAVAGGSTGAAAGSAVPIVGTAAGGVTGAITGAGVGAVGGRGVVQDIVQWGLGGEDTRTTDETLKDDAVTFGMNAAGEGVGRAVMAGGRAALDAGKRAMFGRPVDDAAEIVADSRRFGVEPTAGMVSKGNMMPTAERVLMDAPMTGGRVRSRVAQAHEAFEQGFDDTVDGIARSAAPTGITGSVNDVGTALQQGAQDASDRLTQQADALYNQVPNGPAAGSNTRQLASDLANEQGSFGRYDTLKRGNQMESIRADVDAIIADIDEAGMDFGRLKSIRSDVGAAAKASKDDIERAYLNRLYASLSRDLPEAADAAGPGGRNAFNTANDFFRDNIASKEVADSAANTLDVILGQGTAEEAFNLVLSNTKKASDELAAMRRRLDDDGVWAQFTSSLVERLGKGGSGVDAGEFSGAKFAKGWDGLPEKSKDVLFRGSRLDSYRRDLDSLSRLYRNMSRHGSYGNHSKSFSHAAMAQAMSGAGIGGAGGIAGGLSTGDWKGVVGGTVSGLAMGRYSAKLLTDPQFVNWLVGLPQQQMRRNGVRGALDRLGELGANATNPVLRTAYAEYQRDLNNNYAEKRDKR